MNLESQSAKIYNGYKFEDIIRDIFKYVGYEIIGQRIMIDDVEVDLLIKRNEVKYVVEIKYLTKTILNSFIITKTNKRFQKLISQGYKQLIVVSNSLNEKKT